MGFPGDLMQKNGKFQGGHSKFDRKSRIQNSQLQKNRYPQQGGTIFFLGKPIILQYGFPEDIQLKTDRISVKSRHLKAR